MAVIAEGQKQTFEDRLGRIARGGPNTSGTVFIGSADADGTTVQRKTKSKKGGSLLGNLLMLPLAMAFGALAMMLGRVGLYQLQARPEILPPDYAETILKMGDLGIGLLAMFLFAMLLNMGRGLRKYALALGFIGIMLGEALVIQQSPDLFVTLFSEQYVAQAMMSEAPIERLPETLEAAKTMLAASTDG